MAKTRTQRENPPVASDLNGSRNLDLPAPPHDEFAEQAALGSILMDNTNYDTVVSICKQEDFYIPKHRIIY